MPAANQPQRPVMATSTTLTKTTYAHKMQDSGAPPAVLAQVAGVKFGERERQSKHDSDETGRTARPSRPSCFGK